MANAGGTLGNNTYYWYKDDVLVQTKTGDSTFVSSGSGTYYATVTNRVVNGLTLYTDTITITEPAAARRQLTVDSRPLTALNHHHSYF